MSISKTAHKLTQKLHYRTYIRSSNRQIDKFANNSHEPVRIHKMLSCVIKQLQVGSQRDLKSPAIVHLSFLVHISFDTRI